jgi:hypothetical protein
MPPGHRVNFSRAIIGAWFRTWFRLCGQVTRSWFRVVLELERNSTQSTSCGPVRLIDEASWSNQPTTVAVDWFCRWGPSNSPDDRDDGPTVGASCRCLNHSTSMGGTRSKVEGGDRHDLEPEGLHEDTRHEIYTGSGSRSSYPTSCLE